MRLIILEEAKVGDEVAEPVKNDRGIVILPEGAKLTSSLITRLAKMGVRELLVEGDDPNAPPPKTMDELLEELDFRFEGFEQNAMMSEIKRIAEQHVRDREST
jgi:hypothetical protein